MITLPELSFDRPTRGFLLVGDPHVWSKKPGTRRDRSFLETIIGKIEQAADIANQRNLWALFLGDLLHDDADHDPVMLIRLARALQRFERQPLTLVGNHDKEGLMGLDERNALLLLGVTDQIRLIDQSGFVGTVLLEDETGLQRRVAVGGTPYGSPIPEDVAPLAGLAAGTDVAQALGVSNVVWLTHDDLAFGTPYPGALPLREIQGVDIAVNGHIHATHRPHACGRTAWYNPGNITRLSVDLADHRPSVWIWSPFNTDTVVAVEGIPVPALERVGLVHTAAVDTFTFEGRHATAAPQNVVVHPEQASRFVQVLKADVQQARTDDGTHLAEAIAAIAQSRQTPEGACTIVHTLFKRALGVGEGARA